MNYMAYYNNYITNTHYTNYINYINYINYTNYIALLQVRQDLGLADHLW